MTTETKIDKDTLKIDTTQSQIINRATLEKEKARLETMLSDIERLLKILDTA